MKDVKKLINNRLEELKKQEASLRKDHMKLRDRIDQSDVHLTDVVKLVNQFQEALKRLED